MLGKYGVALAVMGLTGARGGELDLGARVQPAPPEAKFADPAWHIWCGAPVKGDEGKYHLFFSRWPADKGFAPGWAIWSEIAYAVADRPLGPYRFVNVALPARGTNSATGRKFWDGDMTHNPNIVRREGKYLLYYIGNHGDGQYATHRNNDRIGVAIAGRPEGPWTRLDAPIIDVSPDPDAFDSLCTANPGATVRPDGGVLVVYKAVEKVAGKLMGGRVRYGVALADKPEGPYTKAPGHVFEADGDDGKTWMLAEDPYVWFSRRYGNRYYAVARDVVGKFTGEGGGIALFQSEDGRRWTAAAHPRVLGKRFAWADGSMSLTNLERPALLFDGEEPVALFGGTGGYPPKGRVSFNVHIPLRPADDPAARPVVRLMPMGDSITEGGSTFHVYRYPLLQKLTAAGYRVEYVGSRQSASPAGPLPHEGYGGKNADFLASVAARRFHDHPADVLLLHAGHNYFAEDQPVGGALAATESIIAAFRQANPTGVVLLAQVIPSGKLPKYSYLPALNAALADLAKRLHTPRQPVLLVNQAEGFDPERDTIGDKVHPNAAGAEKMTARWFAALQKVLPPP